MLINQIFEFLLHTVAERQHVKDARVSLAYITSPDKQLMRLIFGILGTFNANCRDPEARETLYGTS